MTIRLTLVRNGAIIDTCDTDIDGAEYTGVNWPVAIDVPGDYEILVDTKPDGCAENINEAAKTLIKKLLANPVTVTIKRKQD